MEFESVISLEEIFIQNMYHNFGITIFDFFNPGVFSLDKGKLLVTENGIC